MYISICSFILFHFKEFYLKVFEELPPWVQEVVKWVKLKVVPTSTETNSDSHLVGRALGRKHKLGHRIPGALSQS